GNKLWARNAMGFGTIYCSDITLDFSGNIYVTGDFDSAYIVFGNDTLFNDNLYSFSTFVAKLSNTTGISNVENNFDGKIFPNPSTGGFTVLKPGIENADVVIYDATGRVQYSGVLTKRRTNFNLPLTTGIYFVQIMSGEKSFVQKLIID